MSQLRGIEKPLDRGSPEGDSSFVVRLPTRWDHHFDARRRRREQLGWSTALVVFVSVVIALLVTFRTAHALPSRAAQCPACDAIELPVAWRLLFSMVLGLFAGAVALMVRAHWRRAGNSLMDLGGLARADVLPVPAGEAR
jgi:hypothetical protein